MCFGKNREFEKTFEYDIRIQHWKTNSFRKQFKSNTKFKLLNFTFFKFQIAQRKGEQTDFWFRWFLWFPMISGNRNQFVPPWVTRVITKSTKKQNGAIAMQVINIWTTFLSLFSFPFSFLIIFFCFLPYFP